MKSIISHSLAETRKIASEWLRDLGNTKNKDNEATVVGLYGNLGSGKTTFTQAVAKELGIDDIVTSPTFVIMKIYEVKNEDVRHPSEDKWKRLIHIDAYRLESGRELEALGFEEIVSNPNNLVLIEWAENVKEALPEGTMRIKFEAAGEGERKISFV